MDENKAPAAEREAEERNFDGELDMLLTAFPNVRGQSLPDEVVDGSINGNIPLVQAYAAYLEKQWDGELKALKDEVQSYRAPVRPVSYGAPVRSREADPFLEGLMGY